MAQKSLEQLRRTAPSVPLKPGVAPERVPYGTASIEEAMRRSDRDPSIKNMAGLIGALRRSSAR